MQVQALKGDLGGASIQIDWLVSELVHIQDYTREKLDTQMIYYNSFGHSEIDLESIPK